MSRQTLSQSGQDQFFNFRYGRACTSYIAELPNLMWKTRPKRLSGLSLLAFALPVPKMTMLKYYELL
jgi:hypothetical protein